MFSKYKKIRRQAKIARHQKNVEIWIISIPKSGRTWLRSTVGVYLCMLYGEKKSEALDLSALCKKLNLPMIDLSHGSSDFGKYEKPTDVDIPDEKLWAGKKVVFVSRDMKDVLVSAFHHMKFRTEEFDGDISDFIRSKRYGIERLCLATNSWQKSKNTAKSCLSLTYETLHRDTEGSLVELLKFCLLPIDSDIIRQAVEFNRFDNMKLLEENNFFSHASMRKIKSSKAEARKTREGKVGDYINHLSNDDISYIEKFISNYFAK